MFILAFPRVLTEIGLWLTFFILFVTFIATMSKQPWGKRFWQNNVSVPLAKWQENNIKAATKPFEEYVKYHLGPNGSTPPVHERLKSLERRSAVGEIRQRKFMDNVDVLIAESGPDGLNNFVNLALCDLMECDPADWYGEGWKNFLDERVRDAEVARWDAVHAHEGHNPFHLLLLVSKKTHTVIPVRGRSYPILASGELIGYVGEMYTLNAEESADQPFLEDAELLLKG